MERCWGKKALSTSALLRVASNDCCCRFLPRIRFFHGVSSKIRSSPSVLTVSTASYFVYKGVATVFACRQNQNSWALYGCYNATRTETRSTRSLIGPFYL